jgi:hypothetical protein
MKKSVIIIGGNEKLGKLLVNNFKISKRFEWSVTNIDFEENEDAHINIVLDDIFSDKSVILKNQVDKKVGHNHKYDSMICVAENYINESLQNTNFISATKKMLSFNLNSKLLSLHLANNYLLKNSIIIMKGKKASDLSNDSFSHILTESLVQNLYKSFENNKLSSTHFVKLFVDNHEKLELNINKLGSTIIDWCENIDSAPQYYLFNQIINNI